MRNLSLRTGLVVVAVLGLLASGSVVAAAPAFPEVIPLPTGFQPEGIVAGNGTDFFVGSIPSGAVYKGNLRTGEGEILAPAQEGRQAIGLGFDQRSGLVFAAGGPTGHAFVYDGETGETVADLELTTDTTFVNDVVVTREAAFFTDSFRSVIYRVSVSEDGDVDTESVVELPLAGDFAFVPDAFNANGIDATPNGKKLVIVNSEVGSLYTVDPHTGIATEIDLGGASLPNGDGILLDGKTVYVVQNSLDQVAEVRLNPHLTSGEVVDVITDPAYQAPTTITEFGSDLYAVNAKFGSPDPGNLDFEVVKTPKH